MKPAETKAIYERACRTRRFTPQQEEGEAWHKTLKNFEARDVQAGLDEWWGHTALDDNDQPKSKWLPTPSELSQFAHRAMQRRVSASSEPKVYVNVDCANCGKWYAAFANPGETVSHKCACGAVTTVVAGVAA